MGQESVKILQGKRVCLSGVRTLHIDNLDHTERDLS